MPYRIHKSIDIDFSHHIRGHSGACINVHGHTWKFEVGVEADDLDAEGFVVDFSKLKGCVLKPCHALLDHGLAVGATTWGDIEHDLARIGQSLLSSREAVGGDRMPNTSEPISTTARGVQIGGAENRFPGGMKVALFPFSPTSERLARWLFDVAEEALVDGRVRVAYARIYETLHPVEAVAEYRR